MVRNDEPREEGEKNDRRDDDTDALRGGVADAGLGKSAT
jgi:hypothetical protein